MAAAAAMEEAAVGLEAGVVGLEAGVVAGVVAGLEGEGVAVHPLVAVEGMEAGSRSRF